MNLHHLAPVMEEWLSQSAFVGRVRTVHETQILGTGGTLLKNRDFVGNEPVMLIHADNLCLADFPSYLKAHDIRPPGTEITMMTFTTPMPSTCGIVEMDGKGIVQAFHEKIENPPGNLANAAVYILEPSVIDFLVGLNKSVIDFSTEVLPCYVGKINTFYNNIYHRDIGTIESFLAAQWESPDTITNPVDENNSWCLFCKKDDGAFIKKMIKILAEALQREIIDLRRDENFSSVLRSRKIEKREEKIFVLPAEADLSSLARDLENNGLAKGSQVVLLTEARAGFSSKKILEEQGLRSIAICSGADR